MNESVRHSEISVNINALLSLMLAATSATKDAGLKAAYTRARKHILNQRAFHFDGDILTVQSGSRAWVTHTCTITGCDCETQRGVCWHKALLSALMAYQTIVAAQTVLTTPAPEPTPEPADDDENLFPFSGPSAYGRKVRTGRGYVDASRIGL